MKQIRNLLLIVMCTILIFTPYYVNAIEGETTPTPSESPSPSPSEDPIEDPIEDPVDYEIRLNQTELELQAGKEVVLTAITTPTDAEIKWSSSDETIAIVDDNGKITAQNKAGSVTITAIIKNDTSKTATCKINVTRIVGKDATLKELSISNGKLSPTFQSDITKYEVAVDSSITELKFGNLLDECEKEYKGCQITGNKSLKNGSIVKILVTSEDKSAQKTYELMIVKEEISLNLKRLEINGYALNESFVPETLEYTASIPYEVETISVLATAEDNSVTVKISGLTNLKVGTNTVKVTVTGKDGNSKTYKIMVTREKEVSIEENPTSIITSNNPIGDNSTSSNTAVISKNDNSGDDFLKYAIVSLACLILFAIGGIGIYFYLKTSPKKLKKELAFEKENKNISPIVEVSHDDELPIPESSIVEVMSEDLIQTKEFKKENLEDDSKTDNLFDEEDV